MTATRNRVNLLLFALALLLGAAILLLPEPRSAPARPAVAFEPDAIQRISLDRLDQGEPLRLERRDDGWFVTAPGDHPADSGRVARALAALRERTPSCYPATEGEPGEFGLHPPQARLRLDAIMVAFGYRAPDGRRYIRAQDRLCLIEDHTLPILAGKLARRETDD